MNPERIQGTDGIRGPVRPASETSSNHPFDALLNESVLTEKFFELYAYAYSQELLETGFAQKGDSVVIGWDPRDSSGLFNNAAVNGIRKAGLTAIVVGILPTPAISLYQLHVGATCCFVLTASHNPADQNGIKIFLGHSNLKLFPEDDKRLTSKCFQLDYENIKKAPLSGEIRNEHENARALFIDFMKSPINHWISDIDPARFTILVDGANGAFSGVVQEALESFDFGQLILSNCDPSVGINLNSGVADIEGVFSITEAQIETGEFSHFETLKRLLAEGRTQKQKMLEAGHFVIAFVFDGDGDRCFILSYDPFEDEVIVLNGDVLAHIQAWYLDRKYDWKDTPQFVNTVESDLQAGQAIPAFEALQCAVGDKWILWQSCLSNWQTKKEYIIQHVDSCELNDLLQQTDDLIRQMNEQSQFDALLLTTSFKKVDLWFQENDVNSILQEAMRYSCQQENNRFVVGSEVSGHVITLGHLESENSAIPTFIGNGLKTALNSLPAMKNRFAEESPQGFYKWLRTPYSPGFEKSLPVYYVDKSLLDEGTDFRKEIEEMLLSRLQWEGMTASVEKRPEETEMIFIRVKKGSYSEATVFVRNSGTEDKMSLYLRSTMETAERLQDFESEVYCYLFQRVKNKSNQMAIMEQKILSLLLDSDQNNQELEKMDSENVPMKRLLHEMSSREKLIQRTGEQWSITDLGRKCIRSED